MKYHSYIFLKSHVRFSDLSEKLLDESKKEFISELEKSKKVITNSFVTLGLKVDTDLLLWFQSDELEEIQELLNRLLHTRLGKFLNPTYTLFGITRPTQYSPKSEKHLETARAGKRYLIIYPFTKTRDWYALDFETRRKLMWGHVQIGKKHPEVEQLLLYSYGIDDNEFIVSYETDDLSGFQTLVMELRSDAVREYTLNDKPIFTSIYKPLSEALDYL